MATGKNNYGQCNVSSWKNVISVVAGNDHTVGLRADGTVVATGKNDENQLDVAKWNNIKALSAKGDLTFGIHADGSVISTKTYAKLESFTHWKNIVSIANGCWHIVGLCFDGTVVSDGLTDNGRCNIANWNNLVAIACGNDETYGLRSDGSVLVTGECEDGEGAVSSWTLFNNISSRQSVEERIQAFKQAKEKKQRKLEEARKREAEARRLVEEERQKRLLEERKRMLEEQRIAEERRQKEFQIQSERKQKGLCPYCGGEFKGLFTKKCSACGKPKNY